MRRLRYPHRTEIRNTGHNESAAVRRNSSWEQYHQVFEAIVWLNGWDNDTAALQLFSHLEGDTLNVAHLVPLARRLPRSRHDYLVVAQSTGSSTWEGRRPSRPRYSCSMIWWADTVECSGVTTTSDSWIGRRRMWCWMSVVAGRFHHTPLGVSGLKLNRDSQGSHQSKTPIWILHSASQSCCLQSVPMSLVPGWPRR